MAIAPLAQVVELHNSSGNQKRFTCSNATAISKGILLKLADPRTVSLGTDNAIFAGIAAMDKEANDTSTDISVYTDGFFDIRASGAITAGDKVVLASNGEVKSATLATSGALFTTACIVGTALETAADQEIVVIDIGNR